MARPREFNPEQALDKAMHVFWAKGYRSASLGDLTAAMGISKSSFYETFSSKHELYLSAIHRYDQRMGGWLAGLLEGGTSGRDAIANLFASLIDGALAGDDCRGCLLGNSAIEVSPHDAQVAEAVKRAMKRIAKAFYKAVVRGQDEGGISPHHEARSLARYLLSSVNGLLVVAKANPDRDILEDIARVTLSALD